MLNWLIHEMVSEPAEWAGVIAAIVVPFIGWIGTSFAWVVNTSMDAKKRKAEAKELEARRDEERRRYEETIVALREQVVALQESNRLLEASNPVVSDPLGEARLVKGHMFAVVNEGNRPIVILSAESEEGPDCATYDDFPLTLGHGEALRYMMPWPVNVVIEWRYEDEDESRTRTTKRMSARA